MKNRFLKSIATKLILQIAAGAVISYLAATLLYAVADRLRTIPVVYIIGSFLSDFLGIQLTLYLTGICIFAVYIYLITRKSFRYFKDIMLLIGKIENGNLDERIDIRSDDELGDLALALNRMAEKLKKTMEDEQKAEEAKREIISSVSHDLRTPLTSVIGFLGLLTNRKDHSEEDLQKYASIAHKKALRLQELTDELFEFTRLNYNGVKMKVSEINLSDLLEQLVEEFYPVFEQKQMVCRLSRPDGKINIQGDGDLLVRVFDNLFNNAIRYGHEGKFVDVGLERKGGQALIHVTNYGECIPAEHLPYVFDKFYRAETSRSRDTGGTGLGLAIAKSIVEMHLGTISVESENRQTSFHINLPA